MAVRHEVRRTDGEVCGAARGALRWCGPLPHVAERVRPERSGMGRCGGAWCVCNVVFGLGVWFWRYGTRYAARTVRCVGLPVVS